MMKLGLLVLTAFVALGATQDQGSGGGSGGGTSGGSGCTTDDAGWLGTEPQIKGKPCAAMLPNDCKFIDEAIKHCCATCPTRQNEQQTPGPAQQNQPARPGKAKKGCFHGDDLVRTQQYGVIPMRELAQRRDALVLTRNDDGQLEYSDVRYWLHSQPSTSMKFLMLRTESGHQLSITGEHLIYETDCQGGAGRAIYAKNVQVGRCLYVRQDNELKETRVAEKGQAKMSGIYSPITTTGSIVVNDVLASCYNYYENESLQKLVYQYVIGFQDLLANYLPNSIYQAAFNSQDGAFVAVPRLVFNFLQLSNVFVH